MVSTNLSAKSMDLMQEEEKKSVVLTDTDYGDELYDDFNADPN